MPTYTHTQYEDADASAMESAARGSSRGFVLVAEQQNTLPRRLIRGYLGHNRAPGVLTLSTMWTSVNKSHVLHLTTVSTVFVAIPWSGSALAPDLL